MYDVTAIGELLIDFTPCGLSDKGNVCFETNPGGAPANVAAALARFNKKTAFIGKVGDDAFGRFLAQVLQNLQIDTAGLVVAEEAPTTLAFVHLDERGERSFSFYRRMTADMLLSERELNKNILAHSRIVHFGSVSMTHEPAAGATLAAVRLAKDCGAAVSFDPNLRPALWERPEQAKRMITEGLRLADIVKLSEEELLFLTGTADAAEGSAILQESFGTPLLFVTLGSAGCFYRKGDLTGSVGGCKVTAVDTTGAGDAFVGAALSRIADCGKPVQDLEREELEAVVRFANTAGALAATRKGAIDSMPYLEEIEQWMNKERTGERLIREES
ncbi:PfkB family carbohydrate kinase [Paenibacillus doosanensis]|uniref:PfkB family carbohydrate kinase n=1 Tax=Paenibacillus doosanensis TaxID=1229154 RepID=UPI00218058FE|nr:PfkB family carbohydrate kinase [Paenibacillus doosanensis]MCS7463975.1 PfkB family carbohydrate kinase [Paenibacillus doosanensis]